MHPLNLPDIDPRIRITGERSEIFDPIRKAWVSLTPEEWVRQHFIHYLLNDRLVPAGLIGVEKQIKVNRLIKRCDIVVHLSSGNPVMIVECKSPHVSISRQTFDQAIRYNLALNINYLVLTNGLVHYCFRLDYRNQMSLQMKHIPSFAELGSEKN